MAVLRLRLARGSAARSLTHKEFVQTIHDAAKRAALPVALSGGRQARLRMTAGPPLTLGHVSRCEYVDFEVTAPITGQEFASRLAAQLPEGIEVLWPQRLGARATHLRAAITAFCYTIQGEFDAAKAQAFLRANHWPMKRIRKERERTLDLKHCVSNLTVESDRVLMNIEVRPEGTLKPEEVLESIFGVPREHAMLLPTERSGVRFSRSLIRRTPSME
jgi:radical SAM-linked protein